MGCLNSKMADNQENRDKLILAAAKGDQNEVAKYVDGEIPLEEAKDDQGNTALSVAAAKGHLPLVKYLIEKNAKIETTNNKGFTPLMRAACFDEVDVMKFLLEKGAIKNTESSYGSTALMCAAWNGKLKAMDVMIDAGCNVDEDNNEKWTSLHFAAKAGSVSVVKKLVEADADKALKNKDGDTAYDIADKIRDNTDDQQKKDDYKEIKKLTNLSVGEELENVADSAKDALGDAADKLKGALPF